MKIKIIEINFIPNVLFNKYDSIIPFPIPVNNTIIIHIPNKINLLSSGISYIIGMMVDF